MKETAVFLRISEKGVRRLLDRKLLSHIKVMGSIRIDKNDIISYLDANRSISTTSSEDESATI